MVALDPSSWKPVRFSIYLVVLLVYIYWVVRANRKDRVLLCEALGVGVFLVAFLFYGIFGLPDWLVFLCGFVAVFFAILACYFALLNSAQRRVKKASAK